MPNLKNTRIWVTQDIITELRTKYPKETKNMTDNTVVNWILTDIALVQE